MELPGFGMQDWQSTIRKEVRAHHKYRDMEPWNGSETADITYQDTDLTLTDMLRSHGYFTGGAIPVGAKYYIEVKATTGNYNEPLYVSKAQYQRVSAPSPDYHA